MIHRTYYVQMPANPALSLDIIVEGPVGTPAAPVGVGVGLTAPPPGWVGVGGQYYEIRSRPIPLPTKFGPGPAPAPNFVPRFLRGWHLSITGCLGGPSAISGGGSFFLKFSGSDPGQQN